MNLVKYDDPILTQESATFNFNNPPFDILEFSTVLVETMRKEGGAGLAAPQLGVPYKIFAFEGMPATIAINPRIVETSDETILLDESCLSYPGLFIKIRRPRIIKARFFYPSGEAKTHTFEGMTARVFLHEFDHLIGICHLNRADRFHKEQAERRWKGITRKQKALLKSKYVV